MFPCFFDRPFVRHLYPMEGRTYGSPPAGRSGWLEWLERKRRQRYRDLKIWMCRTPKWSIFGEKPCDQNLGPFFLNFETPSKYAGKDSSSYFAGLPFKGIFLWGDDYRIIIHFEVINVQLTLYQPAFWKGGNSHPCHLYSQENLHVP